jgi:hypothetical protein
MHINRDAAAVIEDEDGIVDIDLNDDDLAVASEVFVNGVVDQFVDQVMKAAGGNVAYVHSRTAADMVGIAENLDAGGIIVC